MKRRSFLSDSALALTTSTGFSSLSITVTLELAVIYKPDSIVQRSPRGKPSPAFAPMRQFLPTEITSVPPPDKRPHNAAAAAQVAVITDKNPGRNTTFYHGGTFGAGIKVYKAFMHDSGAFTNISAQPDSGRISNTNASWNDIICHFRKLVDRQDINCFIFSSELPSA